MTEVFSYEDPEELEQLRSASQDKRLLDRTISLGALDLTEGWFALTDHGVEFFADSETMFRELEERPDVDLRNTPVQRAKLKNSHF